MLEKVKANKATLLKEYRETARRLVFLEGAIAALNDLVREAETPAEPVTPKED